MLTSLRNKVQADLTPTQKEKVRTWIRPKYEGIPYSNPAVKNHYKDVTKPISDHVFGNKTRLTLPDSVSHDAASPDEGVMDFVERHGYETDKNRYKQGIAHHLSDEDKKRPMKIGKILEKHQAPESTKKAYMNDPFRAAGKSHLHTTISRHPFDVAGMSTDRGWTSCISMSKGVYRTNLPKEVQHGTHVAYLHHKNDKTISFPVARVALRPFEKKGDKTLLRAEPKVYGTANPAFHSAVKKWAEHHFPAQENTVYSRNKNTYNDSDEKDHILKHTNGPDLFKKNSLDEIESAADDNLLEDHPLRYKDVEHHLPNIERRHSQVMSHITDNVAKEDLPKLAHHSNYLVRHDVIHRWNDLPTESQEHLKKDQNSIVRRRLIGRGYLNET